MSEMNATTGANLDNEMQEISNLVTKIRKNLLNVKSTWGPESHQYRDALQAMQEFMREKDGLYERMDRMLAKSRELEKDVPSEPQKDIDVRQNITERTIEQFLADLKIQ
ncbi:hypothetical protein PV08_02040 [Exophiala spinifera]|uniref:Uncharacterized protein n=1 Tax=Exophiala spinifera TaxID=91928 RepID=A0A0D2BSR2_9EURO|nr:uncharacterized protein PV08_02040 [Exophiala spinifera]KIW21460.1 hypothetical protein PV08_02040 [Exophiala spinifera]